MKLLSFQQLIPGSELRKKQRESEWQQYIYHQALPCAIVGRNLYLKVPSKSVC